MLTKTANIGKLVELSLCNPVFIEEKIKTGLMNELKEDYVISFNDFRKQENSNPHFKSLCAFQNFIIYESNNLESFISIPGFLNQQLINAYDDEINRLIKDNCENESIYFKLLKKRQNATRSVVTLHKHSKAVKDCAFSASGHEVITCGFDNNIILWDSISWDFKEIRNHFSAPVTCVDISRQNSNFVFGTLDGQLFLSDLDSSNIIKLPFNFSKAPLCCKYIDDLGIIVAAGESELVFLKAPNGELISKYDLNTSAYEISVSNTGIIALACHDGRIKIFDVNDGTLLRKTTGSGMENCFSCDFSDDGTMLFVAGGKDLYTMGIKPYGQFEIIDTSTWEKVQSCSHGFDSLAISCLHIGEGFYAVGLFDGKLVIFNSNTHNLVKTIGAHDDAIRRIVLSPDGSVMLTTSNDGLVKVWNVGDLKHDTGEMMLPGKGIFSGFSRDGKKGTVWLAKPDKYFCDFTRVDTDFENTNNNVNLFKLFDTSVSNSLNMETRDPSVDQSISIVTGNEMNYENNTHTSPFSGPWNYYLIACGARLEPFIYHLLPELPKHLQEIRKITWSKSREGYYALLQYNKILVYDSSCSLIIDKNFKDKNSIDNYSSDFEPICIFSQNSKFVLFRFNNLLYSLDIQRKLISIIDVSPCSVISICESKNGQEALLGCNDCTIKVLDLNSFRVINEFKGHSHVVLDCCYIGEQYFLSISRDKTLRLWDSNKKDCEAVYVSENEFTTFSVDPSGLSIIASDIHGNIYPLKILNIASINNSTTQNDINIPDAHSKANVSKAAELNIQYQRDLKVWKSLPWFKRIRIKKPQRPSGI